MEYRRVVGTAARVMLDDGLPTSVDVSEVGRTTAGSTNVIKGYCGRTGEGDKVPFVVLVTDGFMGELVIWIDSKGKSQLFDAGGKPIAAVQKLLDAGKAVVGCDPLMIGEAVPGTGQPGRAVNEGFPGYTFCYNRPLISEQVRDVLTIAGSALSRPEIRSVHLVATGDAGLIGALASAAAGSKLASATIDLNGFSAADVTAANDPRLLPGVLKYGDVDGLLALAAPLRLTIHGSKTAPDASVVSKVYELAGGTLTRNDGPLSAEDAANSVLAVH
jgi:hypothetical protein